MADNARNYIGIAMDLDVTDLKAGLQETKKEISTANKQFAAATSGMDDWTKSTEGVNAKLKQLDTVLKNQKKNVAGLEAELKKAKKQYGENSEQVRRLNDQLLDATAAVGKTEKAQRKYTTALQNLEKEEKNAADAAGNLSTALKNTDTATQKLKGGFTVLKGVIAGLVTTGINALVGGLQNAVSESREFRREIGYLEQTADKTGVSFDHAKEKLKEVTAITEDQGAAVEGLNNLMTAGFDGSGLDEITNLLTGAAIQWKDTLKFEGLSDSLQEWIGSKGASLTGNFAELLERLGYNLDTVTEATAGMSDEQRRNYAANILAKAGLGEVAEGYREANESLIEANEANFDYSASMATISEKVEPLFTTIKQGWVDVLNAFLNMDSGMNLEGLKSGIQGAFQYFINNVIPEIQKGIQYVIDNKDTIISTVQTLGSVLDTAFKYFIDTVLPAITKGIQFALDNKDAILTGVLAIGGAFLGWKIASIITTVITALQGMKTALLAVATGQRALNLAMMANPIGLIVGLIAGLVAAFITLWNTSDEFRGFWIGLWENIKTAAEPVISFLGDAFAFAWEYIKLSWDNAVGYFSLIWENIQTIFSVVKDVLSGDFQGAFDGIKEIWDRTVGYFAGVFNGIKNLFLPEKTNKAVASPFSGAWDSIKGVWGNVTNWFEEKFDGIIKSAKKIDKSLGSPFSNAWNAIKVVWDLAKGYFQLIWNNIKTIFSVVKSVLTGDFKEAWEGIKKIWDDSTNYFSSLIEEIFGYFADLPSRLIQIGRDMVEGIKDGIKEKATSLANEIANTAKRALEAAKSALGISSPSKVFRDEVGKMIGAGIGEGVLASSKDVIKDINKFNNQIQGKISQIQGNLSLDVPTGYINGNQASNSVTNNNNYTQIINAPKQPSRIELYRQTKNLLALRGGYNV